MSTRQPLPKPANRLVAAGAAFAVALGLGFAACDASATPASGVDQVIRPAFGELLNPPLHHYHPHRPDWGVGSGYGWQYGHGARYRQVWADQTWRHQHGYAIQGPIEVARVDCSDPSFGPTPIADALDALADGGTLYIRRTAAACSESISINRPVTIAGEPMSAFDVASPSDPGPIIAPPPNGPCIQIGGRAGAVEIRDLTFTANQAGQAPCIDSWDTALALTHIRILYTGGASAIYMHGGRILAREATVQSNSFDPAVTLEGVAVDFQRVKIASASSGFDLAPAAGSRVRFDHVSIRGMPGADPGAAPETGLMLRRSPGEPVTVTILNTKVAGFKTGLWFQHSGSVEVRAAMIAGARSGVVSEDTSLTITDSVIESHRAGIYVDGGRAEISRDWFVGFAGPPIEAEPGTEITPPPFPPQNWIYPLDDCRIYARSFDRWCRRAEEAPGYLRDHGDDGPDRWGWDGAPFSPPPPPPPPRRRECFLIFCDDHDGHDHDGHGDRH